ncbi:MAG TPA: DUF6345 domain-containing protein [Chitinophaga sp.]|uniref:DUF6345 domain-containing protein n=1 Tax=Chitinophaga sp. TaxID=1869181 RepID=UPI002D143E49|nr:DUF6345 domain-containing protein [Chitinophaga sp.]HVI47186.1 DUF6345 domain-containing protein [Chitinophaga sp.]
MKYKKLTYADPHDTPSSKTLKAVVNGSNDWYGACSLENFSSASSLSLTHEDAQGFLDYPTGFAGKAANFWFKDAGVQVWGYEEAYDNWQDTYGMDAVTVFYHSGHGNMDGNGVFQAPLGAKWDNRDWTFSNQMAFANEELRYLFFSTCLSLRVSGTNNPVKTWWNPNKGGLRMLFGYETTSVDDPNYGKFFWEEWKKGKSFARAFLDASWRISHGQVPTVMASGANQAEAVNMLNNEKFFSRAAAVKNWYQWQWVGTLPSSAPKASLLIMPKQANAIILGKDIFDDERIGKIANELGLTKTQAETVLFDADGNRVLKGKDILLNVNREGALNIHLAAPNTANKNAIAPSKATSIAQKAIKDLGFDKGIELKEGNMRHRLTCGGTTKGSGQIDETTVVETIVQFRQAHKGIESINSDHGLITVSVDNDGNVTNIYNSTKQVLGETQKPSSIIASPKASQKEAVSVEDVFRSKIAAIASASGNGHNGQLKAADSAAATVLRETIGYDFSDNLGLVTHQKDVEIALTEQFKKRYKLRVPVMG